MPPMNAPMDTCVLADSATSDAPVPTDPGLTVVTLAPADSTGQRNAGAEAMIVRTQEASGGATVDRAGQG